MMTIRTPLLAAVAATALLAATAAQAQRHDYHRGGHYPPHPGYPSHWNDGRWEHSYHNGRLGWWWTTGGLWYLYPRPIYPYPSPYVPPIIAAPQPNMWYYCATPPGYYPYVAQCAVPWQPVVPPPR